MTRIFHTVHAEGDPASFTLPQFAVSAIPEPATVVLMGLGVVGLGYAGRRKLMG